MNIQKKILRENVTTTKPHRIPNGSAPIISHKEFLKTHPLRKGSEFTANKSETMVDYFGNIQPLY
jgi:hypothetical protein